MHDKPILWKGRGWYCKSENGEIATGERHLPHYSAPLRVHAESGCCQVRRHDSEGSRLNIQTGICPQSRQLLDTRCALIGVSLDQEGGCMWLLLTSYTLEPPMKRHNTNTSIQMTLSKPNFPDTFFTSEDRMTSLNGWSQCLLYSSNLHCSEFKKNGWQAARD